MLRDSSRYYYPEQKYRWMIYAATRAAEVTRMQNGANENARPDNPAPCPLRWFRISSVLRRPWCWGKRLNCTWKCFNEYNSWCRNSHRRDRWWTLRGCLAGFFLDNRLCQITVQTFSIIIATFPSANTYLCCWQCLLVNNVWIYDYAFNVAFNCVRSCLIYDLSLIHIWRCRRRG